MSGCNVKLGNSGKTPNSSSSSANSSPTPSPTAPPSLNRSPVLGCSSVALLNCDSTAGCKSYDNKCYPKDEALSKQAAKDKIADIERALAEVDTKVTTVISSVNKTDINNAITDLKKSQTNIEQALPKTKDLIDPAVRDATAKITALKTAQAAFIKVYGEEKTRIEEAKKRKEAIQKVEEEQTKITTALTALNTATTGLDTASIVAIQSVKTAKDELDKHKKALTDLYQTLEKAKILGTADAITAALKNADTEINNLKTAQATFIQAYNEEKNKIEEAEKEEAKNKAEGIKKVKDEQEKIKNALTALTTATKAFTDNPILNAKSVKDAKTDLDAKKKGSY